MHGEINLMVFMIVIKIFRAGVKPLYYYQKDDLFMFASELKAFHCLILWLCI